uniref:GroEL-like chaperonin n=1 Tax=Pantoea phage Survivor TaxID=3232176 RepID=A0AAU8KZN3_9CAUD
MSMLTEISFTNSIGTREIIDAVMRDAYESVCSTMGPNGRYVVINQLNNPRVTKDGVSVAKALDFNEARKNLIAKIITEPSIKTDNEVGDGTTTTVFMTYKLYEAFKDLMTFRNLRWLDAKMKEVEEAVSSLITICDVNDERFRKMLMTSSNYEEEIVDKVLEVYREHKNPNIRLQRAPNLPGDEVKFTREVHFDGQFAHDLYVPQSGRLQIGANKVVGIIIDGNVQGFSNEEFSALGNAHPDKPVLIMARNFDPFAIAQINAENQKLKQSNPEAPVKFVPYKLNAAGSLGSQSVADLGKLLDIDPLFSLEAMQSDLLKVIDVDVMLATAGIFLTKDNDLVKHRAEPILERLDERYESFSITDRQQPVGRDVARRIARLRANNVTINVSGVTQSDAEERYYRYEDVMKAARTGLEFGVIPGIGYGYLMARQMLEGAKPAQSDEGLNQLHELLMQVLTSQYEHLTSNVYEGPGSVCFVDLVTGEESPVPANVYDNAAATLTALKGAWATAKTLGKVSNVMGKSNSAY